MVKFTYIRNFLKNLVMGFKANSLQVQKDNRKQTSTTEDLLLNKKDLEFLLSLVKNSTFKGEQIELIYNLTSKLQKAYLEIN
jgi:hypothetical protein|tara:strand:- start:574 stop:819 length:246 start_codon:yes stop_codon:yes gene_type:complete